MGLKLKLHPNERLVVNGCIIRNNGHRKIELEIENRADLLRSSEMIDARDASTPVTRLCYKVQIALVSPAMRAGVLPDIRSRLAQLRKAMADSHGEELDAIMSLVEEGEFYAASRHLQAIVPYERQLLDLARRQQESEAAA